MDPVAAQYEGYPYPDRDPADERRRLCLGSPSHLAEIDHIFFAGRRDWSRPFRALIAGGGTGDALIMLAQQLAWAKCPAAIIYLDLSRASRAIAEARARIRGLAAIRFETASLLEASAYGPFDYIDCCGVIHHLPDPLEGLRALTVALAPGGGIGLMVYGAIGRRGVYDAQAILRALAPEGRPLAWRLARARHVLGQLPESNAFRRNPFVGDHKTGDAGLFDLLLHARDRAYEIEEVLALGEQAGLRLAALAPAARYDPKTYLKTREYDGEIAALAPNEHYALAERLAGDMATHVAYFTRADDPPPTPAILNDDAIPALLYGNGAALAAAVEKTKQLAGSFRGARIALPAPKALAPLLRAIDNQRPWGEIAPGLGDAHAAAEAFSLLSGMGLAAISASRLPLDPR
ncbi:MAG: methyltransferase [Alphaproteobacteria bacterium]|nr:methyltransferase [Alphaproteobacteria bacterium]